LLKGIDSRRANLSRYLHHDLRGLLFRRRESVVQSKIGERKQKEDEKEEDILLMKGKKSK
jgi:hypothetical protein